MPPILEAQQGCRYSYGKWEVIAMESGSHPRVRILDPRELGGFGRAFNVRAIFLTPLPMKYHGGATPEHKLIP